MEHLVIGERRVGPGEPPYVIAEVGSNHNGDMELARRLVDAAKASGADAVKFQSWTTTSLISRAEYERNTSYEDKKRHFGSLREMVERYQLTPEQHREVADHCARVGITFLSTAFSPTEVDLLVSLGVPCFKVASMDVNHLPLLRYLGSKGKPVIMSTGMASLGEIERAIGVLRESGSGPVALLHCVSIYPPDYEIIHLRNIPMLQAALGVPVGFSDHTVGIAIPLAAIAVGAAIVEKHFTLDRTMEGWDHWVSATPGEMATIAREGRNVFTALGRSERVVSPAEVEKRKKFRRGIVLRQAIPAGTRLAWGDLDYKRPGTGISPDEAVHVVGRTLRESRPVDHELTWTDLA